MARTKKNAPKKWIISKEVFLRRREREHQAQI